MVFDKALSDAQVNFAAAADEGGFLAMSSPVAAYDAVSFLSSSNQMVILDQRHRCVGSSTHLHRLPIGSELLHQGVHEFFSKVELLRSFLPNRPQLEGVDDADVDQPPR